MAAAADAVATTGADVTAVAGAGAAGEAAATAGIVVATTVTCAGFSARSCCPGAGMGVTFVSTEAAEPGCAAAAAAAAAMAVW